MTKRFGNANLMAVALGAVYASAHSFSTWQEIVRLLLRHEPWTQSDFPTLYATAMAAYRLGVSPYVNDAVAATTGIVGVHLTTYPPFTILLWLPFTFLPVTAAFILMTAINWLVAVAFFVLLDALFLQRIRHRVVLLFVVGMLFWESATDLNFMFGQTNLAICTIVLCLWRGMRNGQNHIGVGFALAFATLLKVYFGVFVAIALLARMRRPAAVSLLTLLVALALSLFFFPAAGWNDWLAIIVPAARLGAEVPGEIYARMPNNLGINGLLSRTFDDVDLVRAVGYPAIAAIGAATAYALWRLRRVPLANFADVALPLVLAAVFLVAPLVWTTYFVYLIPAVLGISVYNSPVGSESATARWFSLFFLGIFCLPWQNFILGKPADLIAVAPTLAVLAFWLLCFAIALRESRTTPSELG